jgi:hypothetical protein
MGGALVIKRKYAVAHARVIITSLMPAKFFFLREKDLVIPGIGAGYAGSRSWASDIQTQPTGSQPYSKQMSKSKIQQR